MVEDTNDQAHDGDAEPDLGARMERLEQRLQALEDRFQTESKSQDERRVRRREALAALERGDNAAAEALFPGELDRLKKMQAKRAQKQKSGRRKRR